MPINNESDKETKMNDTVENFLSCSNCGKFEILCKCEEPDLECTVRGTLAETILHATRTDTTGDPVKDSYNAADQILQLWGVDKTVTQIEVREIY